MAEDYQGLTPPPELFKQWEGMPRSLAFEAAYRAGADQELEACCEWLFSNRWDVAANELHAARRPKPPSLKAQALAVIENSAICDHLTPEHEAIIRRALESLPD